MEVADAMGVASPLRKHLVSDVGSDPLAEMVEMAAVPFGQYAHSNQPVHHVLYLYTAIGQPWKTQYWTRRVCKELYNSSPEGFCGDEDNGEMSSWYILSSIGLALVTLTPAFRLLLFCLTALRSRVTVAAVPAPATRRPCQCRLLRIGSKVWILTRLPINL